MFLQKPQFSGKIQELEPRNSVAVMNKINAEIHADCQKTWYSNVRNKNQVKTYRRNTAKMG